jgi:large subunit ribosomal protein L35Ae
MDYRGRRNTYHHTALIKVDGVSDNDAGNFYAGKRVAYIYKAEKKVGGSKFRAVWGKLTRTHGTNGLFRAKFKRNLAVSDFEPFPLLICCCLSY